MDLSNVVPYQNNPDFSILDNKEIELNRNAEKEWEKYALETNLNENNPGFAGEKIRFIYDYKFDPNFREERKYRDFIEVDGGKKSRKRKSRKRKSRKRKSRKRKSKKRKSKKSKKKVVLR